MNNNNENHLIDWAATFIENKVALQKLEEGKERIKKAYKELLDGYTKDPKKIINVVAEAPKGQGLVCENGIKFQSMCQHHFLPFHGEIDIIYEPNEFLVGLGKLPRLVQTYARRLQLQEKLTSQIAHELMDSGIAKGVYVKSKAKHLCMAHRGPNEPNAETVCYYGLGTLKDHVPKF